LYWAETFTGHVYRREVAAPGELVALSDSFLGGHFHTLAGRGLGDSLAVDAAGWVCVATLLEGGITAISPDGTRVEFHPMRDPFPTNVCFGGDDFDTAYVTLSATGKLVSLPWPRRS
jgi:gluconolactonase